MHQIEVSRSHLNPRRNNKINRISYVPLIAPSTTLGRIEFLSSIADTFIYVVSKVWGACSSSDHGLTVLQMGTTGSSDKVEMNAALPDIIERVRQYAKVPIAVGFGVANRGHFDTVADAGADGVVIGSRLVSIIQNAPAGKVSTSVEAFCREISQKGQPARVRSPPVRTPSETPKPPALTKTPSNLKDLPARFGQFGGQYVPEALVDCLIELEEAHKSAVADPEFWKEFQSHYGYMNRPSQLYLAENLTKDAGGAKIWLKREDLQVSLSI
jgi:tryptophan synthase